MTAKIRALACPHCAAPLHPDGGRSTVCAYCGRVLVDLPPTWWARPVAVPPWEGRPDDRGAPRVGLGKHRYALGAKLADGARGEVWRARRDARLTEHVVLRVARDAEGEAAMRAAYRTIERLRGSGVPGAEHFTRLLPQPVAMGPLRGDAPAPFAAAHRWREGFVHTLAHVRAKHPGGVEPRVAVWMWKRLLEQLAFVHASGFAHGAVRPEHCLVHPRAHGVVLVGWSAAVWRHGPGAHARPAIDLAASARVAAHVLRGEASPPELAALLARASAPERAGDDAWALHDELTRRAADALGPPRHSPLALDDEG
ncbi:MAG: hypothetical protein KF729_12465 [Sandaracinaceae bacterium]|nr:hypothetical protein [Sandaracinaceae bacterium]